MSIWLRRWCLINPSLPSHHISSFLSGPSRILSIAICNTAIYRMPVDCHHFVWHLPAITTCCWSWNCVGVFHAFSSSQHALTTAAAAITDHHITTNNKTACLLIVTILYDPCHPQEPAVTFSFGSALVPLIQHSTKKQKHNSTTPSTLTACPFILIIVHGTCLLSDIFGVRRALGDLMRWGGGGGGGPPPPPPPEKPKKKKKKI